MNLREMLVPLALAFATTWAIQYLFFGKKEAEQYHFTAPQSQVECQPLAKNVFFETPAKPTAPVITSIATDWATFEFSSEGATLNRLDFNRISHENAQQITTIYPPDRSMPEQGAFLVALSGQSPLVYHVVDRQESDNGIALVYEGHTQEAMVRKTFTIHKHICQMDLTVQLIPRGDAVVSARILYPAPIMPQLKDQELTAADVMYGADKFEKIYRYKVSPDSYWVKPAMFGVENKYYAHVLVADTDSFVQRAYYKIGDQKDELTAILEGPEVNKEQSWTTSFYLGSKELHAMEQVSPHLSKIIDSGFFKPIYWFMLWLLNWLHDFLHNYGLAIIAMTILSRLILLPFALRAEQGNKSRAEIQKGLQYIQQKYKNDPEGRAKAQADFMRKHGMGLAGCLPMFLQIPIFFGLSSVLSTSVQMYKTPFLWMNDLSAPDPYYILPLLVIVGMLSSAFTAGDAKQRMPIIAMAFMFGAISSSMSAGLVMYIALSTLINMAQGRIFKLFRLV